MQSNFNQLDTSYILEFNKFFTKDNYSQQNKISKPYYQIIEVNDITQKKRCYAYRLLSIAKLTNTLYDQYFILSPRFSGKPQFLNNLINSNTPNSLIILFLVKSYNILKNQYNMNQESIWKEIFGLKFQPRKARSQLQQHFQKLIQYTLKYKDCQANQIKKQLPQPYYEQKCNNFIRWEYQQNILRKLQIIPKLQKIKRFKTLSKFDLWNVKLAKTQTDYYVIVNSYSSKVLQQLQFFQIKTLNQHLEVLSYANAPPNKMHRAQKLKYLSRNLYQQLKLYSQYNNKDKSPLSYYIWLEPNNIVVTDKCFHLSHIPPILYSLGLSLQPMTIEMRISSLTPKCINLYKAPQQFQENFKPNEGTVMWKFILLMDHFIRIKHLYQQCTTQQSMRKKFKEFQKQIQMQHTNNEEKYYLNVVLNTLKKLNKYINWFEWDKRPPLSDLQYHLFDQVELPSPQKSKNKLQTQVQLLRYQVKVSQSIRKLLQHQDTLKLQLPILKDILMYFLFTLQWCVLGKMKLIVKQLKNQQKILMNKDKTNYDNFFKTITQPQSLKKKYSTKDRQYLKNQGKQQFANIGYIYQQIKNDPKNNEPIIRQIINQANVFFRKNTKRQGQTPYNILEKKIQLYLFVLAQLNNFQDFKRLSSINILGQIQIMGKNSNQNQFQKIKNRINNQKTYTK